MYYSELKSPSAKTVHVDPQENELSTSGMEMRNIKDGTGLFRVQNRCFNTIFSLKWINNSNTPLVACSVYIWRILAFLGGNMIQIFWSDVFFSEQICCWTIRRWPKLGPGFKDIFFFLQLSLPSQNFAVILAQLEWNANGSLGLHKSLIGEEMYRSSNMSVLSARCCRTADTFLNKSRGLSASSVLHASNLLSLLDIF